MINAVMYILTLLLVLAYVLFLYQATNAEIAAGVPNPLWIKVLYVAPAFLIGLGFILGVARSVYRFVRDDVLGKG